MQRQDKKNASAGGQGVDKSAHRRKTDGWMDRQTDREEVGTQS